MSIGHDFTESFHFDVLRAATRIGDQLCSTARWSSDGKSCHWPRTSHVSGAGSSLLAPAGDLYAGTSGTALFLAELYHFVPREQFAVAAQGGFRHAFDWARQTEPSSSISAFFGPMGLAYALHHAGQHLPDTELPFAMEVAEWAVKRSRSELGILELMTGAAGAISVLLTLASGNSVSPLANAAMELGERICDCADWTDDMCNWDPMQLAGFGKFPLSGFSHGVSGLAFSLLNLYAIAGDEQFLVTARGAYAYEESLFEHSIGRWLDVRFVETVEEARRLRRGVVAWCHGAGGIALSRLAAMRIDLDWHDIHKDALCRAVDAVVEAVEEECRSPEPDVTLCHGILGLTDILISVNRSAPGTITVGFVENIARALLERYPGGNWPLGHLDDSGSVSEAAMMTGCAGIGHALLRMIAPGKTADLLQLA